MLVWLAGRDLDATHHILADWHDVVCLDASGLSIDALSCAVAAIDDLVAHFPTAKWSFRGGVHQGALLEHHLRGRLTSDTPDLTLRFGRRAQRRGSRWTLPRHSSRRHGVAGNFSEAMRILGVRVHDKPRRWSLSIEALVRAAPHVRALTDGRPFVFTSLQGPIDVGDRVVVRASSLQLQCEERHVESRDIVELAAILRFASAAIGLPRGYVPLACALGVPTVTLHAAGGIELQAPPGALAVEGSRGDAMSALPTALRALSAL